MRPHPDLFIALYAPTGPIPDSAAGKAAARLALAGLAGSSAARLGIRRRRGAAPRVLVRGPSAGAGSRTTAALRRGRYTLSVSHRDGAGAAVAARRGVRAGVDLERDRALPSAHARYFASSGERSDSPHTLAELWALKEAAWKALACTPDMPLTSLRLRFRQDGSVCAVERDGLRFVAAAIVRRTGAGRLLACCWLPPSRSVAR